MGKSMPESIIRISWQPQNCNRYVFHLEIPDRRKSYRLFQPIRGRTSDRIACTKGEPGVGLTRFLRRKRKAGMPVKRAGAFHGKALRCDFLSHGVVCGGAYGF